MEKTLDLKMPGVQEMGREELMEVEGGSLLGLFAAVVTVAIVAGAIFAGKWLAEKLCNCDEQE